jgi:MFS family permease
VVGSAALVGSMVVLSVVGIGSSDWVIIAGLALSGVGQGIASPALSGLVANAVDPKDIGTVAAVQQLMTQMGAVIGTTIMVSVHEATLSQGVVESYGYALLAGAVAAGLGMFFASRVQPLRRDSVRL